MTAKFIFNNLSRSIFGALVSSILAVNAYGGVTALGTEPFTSSTKVNALPNVMFVLDDSGSMKSDFLPDWAGPFQQMVSAVLTVVTPAHRFFNSAYNGVAYNPATRYLPPAMYTSAGALDTTTYPSQTGQSLATGGNASATSAVPNWKAVKVDGYGVQSTATVDLEGHAFSYTTVPGEYCTSGQLRSCTASAVPTGTYTFPAKLRWCDTSANSTAATGTAGTACQASNIANTPTNITNGVTPYTYPRMPRPPTSTVTVTVVGTVTGITVSAQQILSASAMGASTTDVATDIAAKINACTLVSTGACSIVGYSAVSLSNVVTITAPGATATPVVTGATTTVTAFSAGSVPGTTLFTVITPSVTSYPYPGTSAKGANRTDCAGTTCSYAEEMTNYANWYAYYRTRMQMMKTSSSIAFSGVDDKFRVGYYSINNGSGSDFLNLGAFDATQKNLWYTKFFSAVPFGATPLRGGLASTGRMYAGKLSSLNGVAVVDPIQYSCQQNFTILSTDGYWNDTSNPKQIDGTTDIGQQDGSDPRPYYDGGTQTKTVTQTTQTDEQLGINTFLVEQRTQQQQTTSSRLTESVVTTTTYPWTEQTTTLLTQTTPLNQSTYNLQSKTYPLMSSTKQLVESSFNLNSTPRILQSYTYNLTKTTTPLEARTYKITKGTRLLTQKIYNVTRGTQLLTKNAYNVTRGTQLLTSNNYKVTTGTSLVTKNVYNVTATSWALQSSTYKLQSSTRQLQKSMETSSDGGDTWQSTGWVNVSSCTTAATGPGYTRNTQCRYDTAVVAGGLSSCATVAASLSSPYTVGQAVTCAYEATPTVAAVATCNVVAQSATSPYTPSVACAYSTTSSALTGQTSCTAKDQTGSASMSGNKVVCSYDGTPTATTGLSTCSWVVPSPTASSPKTDCVYQTATTLTGQSTCSAVAKSTATTNGSVWNTGVTCAYDTTPTATTGLSSCTWVVPSPSASSPKTNCVYQTATTLTGQTTCSAAANGTVTTNGSVWNTGVTCAYDTTPTTTTGLSSCTWVVPSPVASSPKTDCSYQTATTTTGLSSCSAVALGTVTTNNTVWNTGVTCAYDSTPTTTTGLSSCTWVVPSPVASSPKTDCSYQTATTATGQSSCTVVAVGTATTNGSVWNTGTSCAYDTTPSTTATNQSSCTWVVPSPVASLPRTDCVYNAGAATSLTNQTTCTAVAASTGTTNGTLWSGPAVACAYQTAVTASNLTTCTAGTASAGPVFNAYSTCGYINGTTLTGQNSCVYIADSTGNPYSGPANACAYSTTATTANVSSCTAVAQSPTYAAPSKTCAYQATGTSATNLTTCTDVPQSSGAYPWVGPNVSCAYSTTATTNTAAATCNANRQTTSPYTGPAVDCSYATTPTIAAVTSCTAVAQQTGPSYSGAAVTCGYGAPSGYSTAAGTCNYVPQSTGAYPWVGPARDCRYSTPSVDVLVGTCTNAPQSTSPSYTQLVAKNCVAGSFPVVGSAVVTTVDSCSTAPTSTGSPIVVSTATNCTYQAPTTAATPTCMPVAVSGSSPYVTAVTCSVSDTGYVPVAPTCTAAGTPPSTFDGTGKLVECRTTDQIGTAAAPIPIATCTPGTDALTKVQTNCTTLLSTGPTPVQTCVPVNPPLAPSFVKTTCTPSTTTSTVMGCAPLAPTSPLWQTVSCVNNNDGTYNTLADVASYYWRSDLRTSALNNCTGTPVPPATVGETLCSAADDILVPPTLNNVPITAVDSNAAQHMTTFTLGLGASGYMKYSDTYSTDTTGDFPTVKGVSPYLPVNGIAADPANGVCSWQSTGNCNWPFPSSDEQTTIDDLWHAGVNGRGAYFSATDPVSLSNSIVAALSGVAAAGGAAAAPALSSASLNPSDSYIFATSYTTLDWTGELVRKTIDPYTGAIPSGDDWSVQAKLDAKVSRTIYTFDASVVSTKLKAFTSANFGTNSYFNTPHISTAPDGLTQYLCATSDICLSVTDQDSAHASGANLVKYLAGDRSNEGIEKDNTKYFRQRQHLLGDTVNGQVVYVNKPKYNYSDPGYTAFVTAQASRQAVVYAPANDGMLHAFAAKGTSTTEVLVDTAAKANADYAQDPTNASLATIAAAASATAAAALATDTTVGQELWAYIPGIVMPNLYKLADKKYKNKHRYFVDGPQEVGDVCTSNCNLVSAVWKTILVGGLGRGGRGYYALDITDPANPKALWEFTDSNMGYSYGNPQITKLADGTWVVLLTTGYNNIPNDDGAGGDGVGRLYVLNAVTGVQVAVGSPISTGIGSSTSPSGLAKITAQVVNGASDNTVEAVYGGDLEGNLWRFDVNDTIGSSGYDAQLLAALKDGAGNGQPITTKPKISSISGFIVAFVGTGRYLASSDASDTSDQSFYAIKDPRSASTSPLTPIFNNPGGAPRVTATSTEGFVQQIQTAVLCPTGVIYCNSGDQVRTSTGNPVDFATDNGWFIDLISPSERANTDPDLALGVLAFNTNAPSSLACDLGGKSYSYFVDYLTGGPINTSGNGNIAAGTGLVGLFLGNNLSSAAQLSNNKSGGTSSIGGSGNGTVWTKPTPAASSKNWSRRTSWRELIRGN